MLRRRSFSDLAAGCISQDLAGLSHSRWSKLRNPSAKHFTGQGVKVVEIGYTGRRNAIDLRRQFQFGNDPAPDTSQCGDDN